MRKSQRPGKRKLGEKKKTGKEKKQGFEKGKKAVPEKAKEKAGIKKEVKKEKFKVKDMKTGKESVLKI